MKHSDLYSPSMKKFIFIFFLFLSASVYTQDKEKFSVAFNRNIETYFLAELFAVDYRKTNVSFENYKRTECRKYQPIVAETLKRYGYLKNSKIAKLTAILNDTLVSYGLGNDLLMAPLLYQKEFPTSDYSSAYTFTSNRFSEETQSVINSIIKKYIKELGEFYKSENLQLLPFGRGFHVTPYKIIKVLSVKPRRIKCFQYFALILSDSYYEEKAEEVGNIN